jgi:hypothetical protein
MAIKRVTMNTLGYLVDEIKNRYAAKATTLAGYGITDGMTATEINNAIATAISNADHLQREVVDSTASIDLKAADADKKIYMVKNSSGANGNSYDEYMVVNGALEKVGDWAVDLSGYIKLNNLSLTNSGTGNVVTAVAYDNTTGKFTVTKGMTALQESDFQEITAAEVTALFA